VSWAWIGAPPGLACWATSALAGAGASTALWAATPSLLPPASQAAARRMENKTMGGRDRSFMAAA